jgi:hypothetical protein
MLPTARVNEETMTRRPKGDREEQFGERDKRIWAPFSAARS